VKNGTLRLTPAILSGAGAETKVNFYLELASLKLDSEWTVSLAGAGNADVPPVNLVFTGTLNKAGEISPAVDTAAIEAYLTMRRMQEDVERLETLDVSGRTPPPADADPEDLTSAVPQAPVEPMVESAPLPEAAPDEPEPPEPTAEIESPNEAVPQSAPSAEAMPSATELLEEAEAKEAEIVAPALSPPPDASAIPPTVAEPTPPETPSEAAVTPETESTPAAAEVVVPPQPRAPTRRRRPPRAPEAPDAWKKGINIFGGG